MAKKKRKCAKTDCRTCNSKCSKYLNTLDKLWERGDYCGNSSGF